MYKNKKIIGIIPARGGSKGIHRKNIIDLYGKPLIAYSIEEGKKSKYIDYLMVSTEDDEIADVSKKNGAEVPFMRPIELASDTSKTIDVVVDVINTLKSKKNLLFDILVLLQPTSPLRTYNDIDSAIEVFADNGYNSLVSVNLVDNHPLLMRSIYNNKLISLLNDSSTCRRQDFPDYYYVNGSIYINLISQLDSSTSFNDNSVPYLMDKTHSIDIDEECDLILAEYYLSKRYERE